MTFGELPDGARFWIGPTALIKTLEDGCEHNAVKEDNSSQVFFIPESFPVQQAKP